MILTKFWPSLWSNDATVRQPACMAIDSFFGKASIPN